jgi:putrescine transport system ATP-binding protein
MEKIFKKRRSGAGTLITINNLSKRFPNHDGSVVDNISLSIDEGDLFVLVGPSGCGKTTLLRMIAGFETPDSGSIFLGDKDITHLPPYERPVNMMFQSYALFPHMNVEQNIAFGLQQERQLDKYEIKNRVEEVLHMVNMDAFAKRNPLQLSGGQKQRVALARCLVKRPKVLLLDEPLGALDRSTREHTQIELIKIQYMLETTFVMVTHDQEEAMAMADKMAVMKNGKVLQIGSPEEVYEVPNSRFVAEFVDSINIFKALVVKVKNRKGFLGLKIEDSDQMIIARATDNLPLGATVWLGIRPEEIGIDTKPVLKGENQLQGKIIDYGFLGQKVVYHVELKSKRTVHVSVPTSEKMRNPKFIPGRKVFVSWCYPDGVVLTE